MEIKNKCIFFVISIILILNAHQSNANEQTIQEMVKEFESQLSNERYKIRHKKALEAVDDVTKRAYETKRNLIKENELDALSEAHIGFLNCIKCIAVAADRAYKAIEEAEGISDVEIAKQKILEGGNLAKYDVTIAGIAAYLKLGAAAELVGEYNEAQQLKSIKHLTLAEHAAYSGLEDMQKLSIIGIYCGEPARKLGFKASKETVEASESVYYNNLLESTRFAFKGIDGSWTGGYEVLLAGTSSGRESPEAWAAIQSIKNSAELSASTMTEGPSLDAVYVVRDGIIAAINGIAAVTGLLRQELEMLKNTKLNLTYRYEIKAVTQETESAKYEIAYAAGNGLESLGKAGQKVGGNKRDELEKAMTAAQTGRVASYEAIEVVKSLALRSLKIRNDKVAKETGLTAAIDAAFIAAFANYAQLVNAANIAFDILKS